LQQGENLGNIGFSHLVYLYLEFRSKNIVEFTTRDGKTEEKASYMTGTATKALLEGQALGADIMIVDPPRKGLCDEVLNQLCKAHNPKQPYVEDPFLLSQPRHVINWTNDIHTLIYVSCGFDSLARDCDRLLSANAGWRLDSSVGYVLFPGSDHVESVVLLKRQNTAPAK
jgi:23S rRNA (uracil1939-C5)-methyltransferase